MNHVEQNEILVKLLKYLMEAHRKNWLTSEGLVACLERELAAVDGEQATTIPDQIRTPHIGEGLQRAKPLRSKPADVLARKVNILLDTIGTDSGKRFEYQDVRDCALEAVGYYISRTRWELLKAGKEQVVPEECLHALGAVFGIDPDFLVREDGAIPEPVWEEMSRLRRLRLAEVCLFAEQSLELVDPEALEAITAILREVS
ncbi:hypothetical protein [Arthrobacter glacialis]|uniref:Uncharacterized protein n=1 Tax=Arthrobacter glacialis TaxID=1664 RepID=A0A2S4A1J9_ARTGL|nr:hypothetical protein [Arthrobacter glacialis]POH75189.1 hypothetical protein CVS27_00830 [Arthrobacter glacialis]